MKKRGIGAIFLSGLLVFSLAVGFVGCDKEGGAGSLIPDVGTPAVDAVELTQLTDYAVKAIDNDGVLTAVKTTNEGTTYAIYDTNKATLQTSEQEFFKLDNGLYYTENVSVSDGVTKYTYELYTAVKKLRTVTQEEAATVNEGVLYFADGTVAYKTVNGKVISEEKVGPLDIIDAECKARKIGENYLVTEEDGSYRVYSKGGKFVRAVDAKNTIYGDYAESDEENAYTVGACAVVQFVYFEPESATDFDLITEGKKMSLTTLSFDLISGKVKELKDFKYYIVDNEISLQDYAIVSVQEILKDKRPGLTVVQALDENGKLFADLQDLMPFADSFDFDNSGNYFMLGSGNRIQIYTKSGKLAVTLTGKERAEWYNDGILISSDKNTLYNIAGKEIYTLAENETLVSANSKEIIYTKAEDVQSGGQTKLCVLNIAKGTVEETVGYEAVQSDQFYVSQTSDGVYDIYDYTYRVKICGGVKLSAVTSVKCLCRGYSERTNYRIYSITDANSGESRIFLVRYQYKKDISDIIIY